MPNDDNNDDAYDDNDYNDDNDNNDYVPIMKMMMLLIWWLQENKIKIRTHIHYTFMMLPYSYMGDYAVSQGTVQITVEAIVVATLFLELRDYFEQL